jgi:hypothetical protein
MFFRNIPKTLNLKMTAAILAKTFENLQHSIRFMPESQSHTSSSNSSHKKPRTRIFNQENISTVTIFTNKIKQIRFIIPDTS